MLRPKVVGARFLVLPGAVSGSTKNLVVPKLPIEDIWDIRRLIQTRSELGEEEALLEVSTNLALNMV